MFVLLIFNSHLVFPLQALLKTLLLVTPSFPAKPKLNVLRIVEEK